MGRRRDELASVNWKIAILDAKRSKIGRVQGRPVLGVLRRLFFQESKPIARQTEFGGTMLKQRIGRVRQIDELADDVSGM